MWFSRQLKSIAVTEMATRWWCFHMYEKLVYTGFEICDDDYFCANQKETIRWNFQWDLNSWIWMFDNPSHLYSFHLQQGFFGFHMCLEPVYTRFGLCTFLHSSSPMLCTSSLNFPQLNLHIKAKHFLFKLPCANTCKISFRPYSWNQSISSEEVIKCRNKVARNPI